VLEDTGLQDNGMTYQIQRRQQNINYISSLNSRFALEIGRKHIEDRRLRVFENWVLRKIFGPKRDEVK
jgi:hypothetical protein